MRSSSTRLLKHIKLPQSEIDVCRIRGDFESNNNGSFNFPVSEKEFISFLRNPIRGSHFDIFDKQRDHFLANLQRQRRTLPNDRIACGLSDGTIEIRNMKQKNEREQSFKAHEEAVSILLALPDGSLISAANNTIKIWNPTRSCLNTLKTSHSPIIGLILSPQMHLFALTGPPLKVSIWTVSPTTPQLAHLFREKIYKQKSKDFYSNWKELLNKVRHLSDSQREELLMRIYIFLKSRMSFLKKCIRIKDAELPDLWKRTEILFEQHFFEHPEAQKTEDFLKTVLFLPIHEFEPRLKYEGKLMEDFKERYNSDCIYTLFAAPQLPVNVTWESVIRHGLKDRTFFGYRNRTHKILQKQCLIDDEDHLTSWGEKNKVFREAYLKLF